MAESNLDKAKKDGDKSQIATATAALSTAKAEADSANVALKTAQTASD